MDINLTRISELERVAAALNGNDKFLLAGHVDPDPDCIGSLLALDWALTRLGKTSLPITTEPLQPAWSFLPGFQRLRLPIEVNPDEWRVLVVIDCEVSRTGAVAAWANGFDHVINIDHHPTNPGNTPVQYIDPTAAATGEIIYHLVRSMGLQPDKDSATLLYTAIMADTGSFRFSNTTADILHVGAELVRQGAQPDVIARQLYETHSGAYLQLLQKVLSTFTKSAAGKAAWITITSDTLNQAGVRKDETEGLVQYPRMIAGVEVSLVFREVGPAEVRVGFRSREWVDVSGIAREFGGGGHVKAAGCTIRAPLVQARQMVVQRVLEVVGDSLA